MSGPQPASGRRRQAERHRYSYFLEAIPRWAASRLNSSSLGFWARVGTVAVVGGGVSLALVSVLRSSQDSIPLAKRSSWLHRWTAVTLIERTREEGLKMEVFRFALPKASDYAGYEPISSVQLASPGERRFSSVVRWFTPISHPEQRGYIEFAVKDADPGRMAGRLLHLRPGDQLFLGRWMREFRYEANAHDTIGLVTSFGGVSVALQLLSVIVANPLDRTQVSFLYCCQSAASIPFRKRFDEFCSRRPGQFSIHYNVLSIPKSHRAGYKGFLGHLDQDTIAATMPPPEMPSRADPAVLVRPPILVCASQLLLQDVCGRSFTYANKWYTQGGPLLWHGFMPDMGYQRSQVYKFGTSTHFFAFH